jgi:NADH-quinone oxidoreductase subunit C
MPAIFGYGFYIISSYASLGGSALWRFRPSSIVDGRVSGILPLMVLIRYDSFLALTQLLDLFGLDRPSISRRFELIYWLLAPRQGLRLLVRLGRGLSDSAYSLTSLYSSSGWLERECWDLLGIPFFGNVDLRRILTNYGFEGYPLRRDFPSGGYVEVRYDEAQRAVVEEPLALSQEFRFFDFTTPWVLLDGSSSKTVV